ncbi:unnamed protein product [Orchesella dallaii]|uniref:CCHC-type domain-containing protein n=1 Tax=Orchesella dallaii TaxID=48710 RepID=A0ABP1PZE4_9HEXA
MRANSRRRPISTSPQVVVHSHRTRSNRSASVDSPLLSLPPPTRRRRVVKSKVMAGQANNANVPVGPQVVLDANLALAPTERGNFVRSTEPQRVKCYNCEEIGHYARDCDKQVRNANGSAMLMQAQNANNNPSGNGSSNQPPQSNSSQFSQEREPQRNNSLNFRGNRHRNRR